MLKVMFVQKLAVSLSVVKVHPKSRKMSNCSISKDFLNESLITFVRSIFDEPRRTKIPFLQVR